MTTLTLELPSETYYRLREEAERAGKLPQAIAQEWLIEQLTLSAQPQLSEREQVQLILAAHRLLAAPSDTPLPPTEASLEEVEATLSRAGGPLLSEIAIEQRGPI